MGKVRYKIRLDRRIYDVYLEIFLLFKLLEVTTYNLHVLLNYDVGGQDMGNRIGFNSMPISCCKNGRN